MITEQPHNILETGLESPSDWDIPTIVHILRCRAWVFAVWMAIFLAIGIGYVLIAPNVYSAKTVVQVEQLERPVINTADVAAEALAAPEILKTFEQNLDSGALLLRVFKNNKLDQDRRFLAEQDGLSAHLVKWISRVVLRKKEAPPGEAAWIRDMDNRAVVKLRRGTRLIDASVRAQDPSLAQQLSQSLVNEFIRLDFDLKIEAAKPSYEYLLKEAERLRDKLQKSEHLLQTYKEEQNAVSLEGSQNIVVETLKSLNANLNDARTARMKLDLDYTRLEGFNGSPTELLSLAGVAASPDVLTLKQRIADAEGALASLGQRYTPKSSKYLQSESELKNLKLALDNALRGAAGIIRSSYASARETESKLLDALHEQEKHALELNRIAIQYNVLTREVASDDALYQAVLKELKEIQIIQGVEHGGVRIVELATLPDKPVFKKKLIVLAVAIFLGAAVGVAASVGPSIFKAPLFGVADVERLGIPLLGAVPVARSRMRPQEILLLDNPRSPSAESFRSVRTMLLLPARTGKSKVILFTSAAAGEGKTFCSINAAASLAIDGRRVLLIDADLRSPAIGIRLFGKQPAIGLTDVLSGKVELENAVQPTKAANLFVLTAGSPTEKPSELLGSPHMAGLLEKAMVSYDHIIMDSAPVLEASDALRILTHVNLVCMVARCGSTSSRVIARALQLLASAECSSPVGMILNRTPSA